MNKIAKKAPQVIDTALIGAQKEGLDRLDAQLLLLHLLGREAAGRAWLFAHGNDAISSDIQARFYELCTRRRQGEPVAYLTGHKWFYGVKLSIDSRVLDPRADTETLVDWAMELLADAAQAAVLDLGTGSGAIALAIAHAAPQAQVMAVDRSEDALAVARTNADRLNLPVRWSRSDWFSHVDGVFDLIVSNPPYIAECDPHLSALRYEPLAALVSGPDGLRDLRAIAIGASAHLALGGWLLLEHGWNQSSAVQKLLRMNGFDRVQTRNDLAGTGRCTGGLWPGVK